MTAPTKPFEPDAHLAKFPPFKGPRIGGNFDVDENVLAGEMLTVSGSRCYASQLTSEGPSTQSTGLFGPSCQYLWQLALGPYSKDCLRQRQRRDCVFFPQGVLSRRFPDQLRGADDAQGYQA